MHDQHLKQRGVFIGCLKGTLQVGGVLLVLP